MLTSMPAIFSMSPLVTYGATSTALCCRNVSATLICSEMTVLSLIATIVNRKAIHVSMRIVYGLWICLALVLSSSYGSSFYSLLTVPEYERPVDTIENISAIAQTDHKYLIVKQNSSN